jgi:HAD superfamily hydrolase (TIGR01509 family)
LLCIKGAIFDLDGTLLDSMSIWRNMAVNYLRSQKIEPKDDLFDRVRTMSLTDTAVYFREEYGIMKTDENMMAEINAMVEDFYNNAAVKKDYVIEFLDILRENKVKMCLATATDRYLVEPAMRRNGLSEYIDKIFTCTEAGAGKDTPEIFLMAQEYLGTPIEHTYVFEDSLFAIKSAKKAGFPVVGVYDRFSDYQKEEVMELSDIFINGFDELIKIMSYK